MIVFKGTHVKGVLGAVMIASLATASNPAFAVNDAMLELLQVLKEKGDLTQDEFNQLLNAAKTEGEEAQSQVRELRSKLESSVKETPVISTKGKLEIASRDGSYKFRVGGRLQADLTAATGDNSFPDSGSAGGDVVSEFRRARLYASGVLDSVWKFKFQYDFTDSSEDGIRDAYLSYSGLKPVELTFGHHKVPFSLEELTSSKYITFIERSQFVNALAPGRRYALTAKSYFDDQLTIAGSVHLGGASEATSDDELGFTGRLTYSPIHEKNRMLHIGLGLDRTKSKNNLLSDFDGEPEIHPGADLLDDNGEAGYDEAIRYVVEASGFYGPYALQAEYSTAGLKGSNKGHADADYTAWYIYGSYYLTGESRRYNWKEGSFSQTKVKNPVSGGGLGAWELGLRYSGGDFEDGATNTHDEAEVLTVGLNWYPSNNVRFSANYINVLDANEYATRELAGDLDAGAVAEDAEYFVLRGQWYF
jgi:phosphate-selective porin OprO/OprP